MAGFRIEGSTSGNVAEVDANNNFTTTLPTVASQSGLARLAGTVSETGDPVGLVAEAFRMSTQGRLTVGQPVTLMNEVFNYTAINTTLFSQAATTQTITVAGGTLNLNAGAVTTLSTYSAVKTYSFFPLQADLATYCLLEMSLSNAPQTNCTIEVGFFQAATNAAPTDGAFFRYDTTGTLKCVLNNNGTEYTSAALTAPAAGVMHKYKVIIENDRALFYIDGACQAIIASPTGLGMPLYAQGVPFQVRCIHGAVAPALANTPKVGYVYIGLQDAAGLGRSMVELAALAGKTGAQGQSGQTMGSTALMTNSQVLGAGAAASNTLASLGVGLGGQFVLLPTLTAVTDGILCSYLNPIPTAAVPGKQLYIKGVKIQGLVTTVLAGGPLLMAYSLAFGHNALGLNAAEGAGTKAPRRVPLGFETYVVTAPVGTLGSANGVYMAFDAPILVNPGEYVAVVVKNLGTVTTTGAVTYLVAFNSYWE